MVFFIMDNRQGISKTTLKDNSFEIHIHPRKRRSRHANCQPMACCSFKRCPPTIRRGRSSVLLKMQEDMKAANSEAVGAAMNKGRKNKLGEEIEEEKLNLWTDMEALSALATAQEEAAMKVV